MRARGKKRSKSKKIQDERLERNNKMYNLFSLESSRHFSLRLHFNKMNFQSKQFDNDPVKLLSLDII